MQSDSQAYKAYIRKLASSGLPACKKRLAMLAGMERSEAFQWWQENIRKGAHVVPDVDAKVNNFLADVLAQDEAPAQPSRSKRARKATRKAATAVADTVSDSTYRFSRGLYGRYGITPQVNSTFKGRRGGTFVITDVQADHVLCCKA